MFLGWFLGVMDQKLTDGLGTKDQQILNNIYLCNYLCLYM